MQMKVSIPWKSGMSKPYEWLHFLVFFCVIYISFFGRSPEEFHLEQTWLSFLELVSQVLEKRNVSTALQVFIANPTLDPQDPISNWQLAWPKFRVEKRNKSFWYTSTTKN